MKLDRVKGGVEFILRPSVRNINLNYKVKRLNKCADNNDDCIECSDLELCRNTYDARVGTA